MRILVTGREGQLARSLAERGLAQSHFEIVRLGRPELDLEDFSTIASAVESAAPDLVINAAAYTAVDAAETDARRCMRVNAEAVLALAAAADRAGARFVQISTDYVFDGRAETAYREDAPTNPLGIYGLSKRAGERAVAHLPNAIVVRTAWVYSPFGKNFLRTMMALAGQRDEVTVVADQCGNPTSALDIADGLLALAEWLRSPKARTRRIYHLAGSGTATWFDFAEHIMAELERLGLPSARVKPIRTEDWPTPAERPRNSRLDSSLFEGDFGYRAPDWRRSATQVIERLASEAGKVRE